ncbi:MAG: serine hydrolase domain-containing protein [Planctomycetota bacterium]
MFRPCNAIGFLLATACYLLTTSSSYSQRSLQETFETLVEEAAERDFSGMVLAQHKGEIIAAAGIGYADPISRTAIDSRTLFEIGSITKPITSLALVILERQGKLSLEDSIADHLPSVPANCRGITIKHLMQHTSGIPGTNYGPTSKDISVVTKAYLKGGPKKKPGSHFEYWNQGYALLAAIIAEVNETTYPEAIDKLVFRPAKMKASCFTGDRSPNGLVVSVGQSTRGPSRSALEHPYGNFYGLQYQGMGGVVTNADDLLSFVNALSKSKASLDKILQPGPDSDYGLGWWIKEINETDRRIFHTGSVRGFLSAISWYPERESSFIVLANTDDRKGFFQVESSCRKAFEAMVIPLPKDQQFEDRLTAKLVGQYVLGNRVVTISKLGDGLEMIIDWGGVKTFGKLAKSDSTDRLIFLDGSGDDVFISIDKSTGKQVTSLIILDQLYVRR